MLSQVLSAAILGIDAYQVEVEVDIALGLTIFRWLGCQCGPLDLFCVRPSRTYQGYPGGSR